MRAYFTVLAILWSAGSLAAAWYAGQQQIPWRTAAPVAAAFLLELSFYFSTGWEAVRSRWRPWMLAASALIPYSAYSIPCGVFHWRGFLILAFLSLVVTHWFERGTRSASRELLLLGLMAAVYLAKPFRPIYLEPFPDLRVDALGQLMWFRLGLMAVLSDGGDRKMNFGFVPAARDWVAGLLWFAAFLPAAYLLNRWVPFVDWGLAEGYWWKGPATFAVFFFTIALGEEVFFRGVLQRRLSEWWGGLAGWLVASAAFAFVHLWFRQFPNYPWVAVTFLLGLFCGRAFAQAGVRASMITHALVVAVWRSATV